MGCNCGKPKCDGHCGVSPAVLQINNPSECVLFHRVEVPASMGDSKTNPPKSGAYKNVLLYYEADQTSWLYSSDGIPQKLVNGLTDYEDAINLPQINGVTLLGNKSSADLKLADAPMVITIASGNTSWSGADTAEDIYNFFLNQGKVNVIFEGSENYGYEIVSAAYIPGEQKMMCMVAAASIDTGSSPVEFSGNALYGLMTFYTVDKAVDVGELDLQPKLFITDFTGLDLNYNELSGVPATTYSIGMVKPGDGLEVASDGTLTVIDHVFDTVADMKLAANLVAGSYAQTLGFHTLNDGGGATYFITDSGTANEMDVIAVDDLYANLVIPKIISPSMVGAYADDTHDDSSFIRRAIELGNDIDLENKTYLVADTIVVDKSDIRLHHGKIHSTATAYVYRLSGSLSNVAIEYHECYGTDPDRTTSQYFIGCLSASGNNFKNIKIQYNIAHNMNAGISINADLGGDFKDIYIAHNIVYDMYGITPGKGYGIHVANGNSTFTNTVIEDNEIYHCERHCLYTARGRGYIIRGNFVHNNIDEVYSGGYKPAVNLSRSRDITFENNTIKDCINGMLYFASELQPEPSYALTSYPCRNINVINNLFEGNTNLAAIVVGYAETPKSHAQNINILNNKFNDTGYIALYACENVRIDGNCFSDSQDYCLIVYGGTSQTETVFTRDIYVTNNKINTAGIHRPIRLNTLFTDNDAYLLFENNTTNFEKFIVTQSNVKNNKIQVVNQAWNSDFTFDGGSSFMSYPINGVAQ